MEGNGQFIEIVGTSVGQCVVHLAPNTLVGIEFRRIRRETLQVKPRETATELAHGFAFVGLAVVPDHDDRTTQMTE